MKKKLTIINIIILIIIMIFLLLILIRYTKKTYEKPAEECLDVDFIFKIKSEACYDYISKNIFIIIKRFEDGYNINKINISFLEKEYISNDAPKINETKRYKISSSENPRRINIGFNTQDVNICNYSRTIMVENCSANQLSGITVNISTDQPLPDTETSQNRSIEDVFLRADIISSSLFEEARIFKSSCKSSWSCLDWGECIDGIQRRKCEDKNNCIFPTDIPDFTKRCGGECKEEWECKWSACINNYTMPTCKDRNNCGTTYSKPTKLGCIGYKEIKCIPEIICNKWSECKINYNFIDLSGDIENINGIRSRICEDKNNCIKPVYETKECSTRIDIYTKLSIQNGQRYIEIYDKLNDKLIAKINFPEEYYPIDIGLL